MGGVHVILFKNLQKVEKIKWFEHFNLGCNKSWLKSL